MEKTEGVRIAEQTFRGQNKEGIVGEVARERGREEEKVLKD